MIVVADTSPLNYLILIEEIDILTKMYGTVVIPYAVQEELLRPTAPQAVRIWVEQLPSWIQPRNPVSAPDPSLVALDPGEHDAILLASELRAHQLIVDDRQGRREAQRRGIPVMGTLGVLREAAALGLLDLETALKKLKSTSFHIAPDVLKLLLKDKFSEDSGTNWASFHRGLAAASILAAFSGTANPSRGRKFRPRVDSSKTTAPAATNFR